MSELWLNFNDQYGERRRVNVAASSFTVGRQPDNDLTIPDSRLSRTHLKIDRFGDVFVASDCGSSNGTTRNGTPLEKPESLANGDRLNLGGFEIDVELVAPVIEARRDRRTAATATTTDSDSSPIPTAALIAAPLLAIMMLLCGGGAFYLFSGGKRGGDIVERPTPDRTPIVIDETPGPTVTPTSAVTPQTGGSPEASSTPIGSDETRMIEGHSTKFLRAIALNDPSAFLTTPQIEILKGRISQFRSSAALASNMKSVRANASQFTSTASANGFKPDFLAAAALVKLGNRSGDPVATLKTMMPFLSDLRISLGNSLADDNLLIMADYPRRERNSGRSLQSILEGIPRSKIGDADPREIRTIWFLRKNDKITEEMYDFALRFLAVGTIMQNPQDFNVNSEPVVF